MIRVSPAHASIALALAGIAAWLGWSGGPISELDRQLIARALAARAASEDFTSILVTLTWIGSAYVTLGATALAAAINWLSGRRRSALWLAVTVSGGRLLVDSLKLAMERPRPAFEPYAVPVSSFSFPSGHAANTMVAFGALALIAVPVRFRGWALAAAIALSLAIGATRPLLGVHWPSDVLAGWLIGAAVLVLATPFRPRGERSGA